MYRLSCQNSVADGRPANSALHRAWSRNLLHRKYATIPRRGSKPVSLGPLARRIMSVAQEFATVDVLLASSAETRGVDAFALALLKAERQIRRLFTFLVYQSPAFGPRDVPELRATLGSDRFVYFNGFIRGIDLLCQCSIESLVGNEYSRLRARLDECTEYRGKIFHGQLTDRYLTREELVALVVDIREWCDRLATGAGDEFGYDGFRRGSFTKSV
jgi:hypothetical protein